MKAVVIFSGGQDSTTCLKWAINRYKKVEAITFNYGQKHNIEIEQSKIICKKYNIKQTLINIDFLNTIVESALISNGDINKTNKKEQPSSFVPNRNQLFITLAHSYAQKINFNVIVTGVCQTDYNGFADCRESFIKAIEWTTNLGSKDNIIIETPLMYLTKSETFLLAKKENCLDDVINLSHTCYNGNREKLNEWGYGCDNCPACKLRKEGYNKFLKNELHINKNI
jgi:7-cyano-7-deazaguanine synthase|tara:strand:- start:6537 stop:7214 length:678 start_codon:yes stop_codon:yes gene_type:complete